jgi:ribosomal protein L37AE/L43A
MSYEPGARPVLMPPEAAEQMRQKFECEQCSCHYSSVGAAFFCPACGHNSSRSTFDQTVALVRNVLASIDDIAATVEKKLDSSTVSG